MADGSKKVLEKKGQGDYEFTAYGEFLSYFHAHIDIFKKLLKSKKMDPGKIEEIAKQIKSFMSANIKKSDHFFENLSQFATILGVPKDEVSAYLNSNFIEVLTKVQEKLKSQEIEKMANVPEQTYRSITEEIVEKLGFAHPADFLFVEKGILLVLENPKTGEIMEPQGLMAESVKAALSISPTNTAGDSNVPVSLTEAITKANAPPQTSVKKTSLIPEKEKSILQEIVENFGDTLTGEKLEVQIGPPPGEQSLDEAPSSAQKKDDYEIEDIEFDDSPGPSSNTNESDDLMQDIDVEWEDVSTPEPEPPKLDPNMERLEKYSVKEYIDLIQTITNFQTKSDQVGYQNWLKALSDFEKAVVSLRTQLLKEQKNEPVDWNTVFIGLEQKTEISKTVLTSLQKKVKNYQIVKMTLDRTIQELKKGSPEFIQVVRLAWPHIQKSFFEVPNFGLVQTQLRGILSKVADESHKKEFTRIFTMALNFIQSKFQV